MKAYTDLSQSKNLAEILPLESADMKWFIPADNEGEFIEEVSLIKYKSEYALFDKITDWNDTPYLPCWSLAALLSALPYTSLHETFSGWRCDSYNKEGTSCILGVPADNPVDACYEMILKLHELNLL